MADLLVILSFAHNKAFPPILTSSATEFEMLFLLEKCASSAWFSTRTWPLEKPTEPHEARA
jgi:hypothetical protein